MENNMKYLVSITETNFGFVEVEATSQEDAREKAEIAYFEGEVMLPTCDVFYGTPTLTEEE